MNGWLVRGNAVCSAFNTVLSEMLIGKGRRPDELLWLAFHQGYLYSLKIFVSDNLQGSAQLLL